MDTAKVTFIGDIMCEPLLLKAAHQSDGTYNFDSVFKNVIGLLKESDYVVGNLETPLAGEDAVFTNDLFSFNAPDDFASAIKAAGINLVNTANNHCLDRGIEGLRRTLRVLDEKKLAHTGTFDLDEDRKGAFYVELNEHKYAFVFYTYGTNFYETKIKLADEQKHMINLLRPQEESPYIRNEKKKTLPKKVWDKFLRQFSIEHQCMIKKIFHRPYNSPREDNYLNEVSSAAYILQMQNDIREAKKNAEVVFFCPHLGGQFNINPGCFTEYVIEKAVEAGCDAIIASHPHIVQRATYRGQIPCFYSLGNFSMSPNSIYLLHEHHPEFGLAVHMYCSGGKNLKVTFTILKIFESKKEALTVIPIDELVGKISEKGQMEELEKSVKEIFHTVTGSELDKNVFQREYLLKSRVE